MKWTYDILEKVVRQVQCLPGWHFRLKEEDGAVRLVIRVAGYDSAIPAELRPYTVDHFFPAPQAEYNEKSWRRWVFECCRRVMNHEIGEWMRFGAERPFAPMHGPGEDPYTVHEIRTEIDALTTQDGSIREPYGP